MRPNRVFIFVAVFFSVLVVLPVSAAIQIKSTSYSMFRHPIAFSRDLAQAIRDLVSFHKNAEELRVLRRADRTPGQEEFHLKEVLLENQRLNQLLEMRRMLPAIPARSVNARVIARSPGAWNRVFLIDKGTQHGIRVSAPVLSQAALIGKIVETGPAVSKTLLITDPNSRVGALVQRTRDQGILYGTFAGECRMKYLSLEAKLEPGDLVESAGYGGFFPKGLLIGKIEKVWKEPGQIYQVASVQPFTDLARVEEVVCVL